MTSGIRLGSAALTTRGLGREDMATVAAFIAEAIEKREDAQALAAIRARVTEFARQFPLFSW